jgi:L-ascorbate metabolism protein UlaG (beta-lactamase superfamily)
MNCHPIAATFSGISLKMRKKMNPYYKGPISDHFDGERFFVAGHVHDKSRKDLMKMARGTRAKWPRRIPSPFHTTPDSRVDGLRSTLIGHASFLVQAAGINLLIDPVFAKRASPFGFVGPSRANPPGIAFDNLPPIDAVLITHSHYDHMDKAALRKLAKRHQPAFICPLGVDVLMQRQRVAAREVRVLDWWDSTTRGALTIHAIPTYHWSARGIRDRRQTLWCSFAIETPAGLLYHIGDTGYGAGQFSKDVRARLGEPALAHIPIGAYEPRWFMKDVHVNPEEAVQIFQDCGAKRAIGHHWGTFQLTQEPHDQPEKDLAQALAASGIAPSQFQAFRPGQVLEV